MTIDISNNDPRIAYSIASGTTQTNFTVPFEFFDDSDLQVYVNGILKTISTDYTVSGGDGSTGTITMEVTGVSGGSSVVITRNITIERTTDFTVGVPINRAALNTQLDILTAISADLQDSIDRTLKLTDYDTSSGLTLPDLNTRKGKTLVFNSVTGDLEPGPSALAINNIADYVDEINVIGDDLNSGGFIAGGNYDLGSVTDTTVGSVGSPDGFIVSVYNNLPSITTVSGISSNVATVASISADVTDVASNASDITTVATNIANVNAVGSISANVTTVAGISSDVTAVAADATDIGTVAALGTEIGALGAITSDITTAAGNTANITTVAGISANVTTVAGISADVTTVAGITSDIALVVADATDIGTVAGDSANIQALGPISADISTVSGIAANVTTVAGISANTTTVAGIAANVTTVAGIGANVTTVAGISADVSTVAADSADIQTVADNLTDINAFAETYRIGATDPTTSLDTGDLFFNTTSGTLKVYNGSSWEAGVTAGSGFMPLSGGAFTGAVTFAAGQTFDGRDVSADGTKLDGIEAGATADQTGAEIKSAYEAEADTNAFTDAEKTKLAGIEASADVTDAANVEPLVDAHINTSTATTGQYLSWNGADYAWATVDLSTTLSTSGGTLTGALNGTSASFSADVSALNFNTTSDANLKTNVETLTGSLSAVKSLRGVTFDWIESGNSEVGVIAQEVEAVIPDLVTTNSDGVKSVKYGNIVAVLIEAIKEQQKQIDALVEKLGE